MSKTTEKQRVNIDLTLVDWDPRGFHVSVNDFKEPGKGYFRAYSGTAVFGLPSYEELVLAKVAGLRKAIAEERAEVEAKAMDMEVQISKLLAIRHTPGEA